MTSRKIKGVAFLPNATPVSHQEPIGKIVASLSLPNCVAMILICRLKGRFGLFFLRPPELHRNYKNASIERSMKHDFFSCRKFVKLRRDRKRLIQRCKDL